MAVIIAIANLAATAAFAGGDEGAPVAVKIIAINDFHGQMESPGRFALDAEGDELVAVGGIDWLAGHIAKYRRANPNAIVVSAGDLIGATPPISALFHDEPTIEVMNRAGLAINAVGNHEFDEGAAELRRMQAGGCHPSDRNSCMGAAVGTAAPFEGARFAFLAANVVEVASGKTLFPPYAVERYGDARIAFIGVTLKETPTIVSPIGVASLAFLDEAETVNTLVPELRRQGIEAIVLLIHQGGVPLGKQSAAGMNGCEGGLADWPIEAIVRRLDDAVDLVVSGHTHMAYVCAIANAAGRPVPVTSAHSQGRVLTEIDMVVDSATGHVQRVAARNVLIGHDDAAVTPDPEVAGIVAGYKRIAAPMIDRVVGRIAATLSREPNDAGESNLGDVIADAQLAATDDSGFGDAVIAFTNPGGIRADLAFEGASGEGEGMVTYGEIFSAQPFGNSLVTLSLTGEQIHTLLEQQFTGCRLGYPDDAPAGQPFGRILQVSRGFAYSWRRSGGPCDKVDPAGMTLNGAPLDPARSYRVTVNSFLAAGGDQFYVLTEGVDRLGGAQDLDALEAYVRANAPLVPGPLDRITLLP